MTSDPQESTALNPFSMMQMWQKQMQSFLPTNIFSEPILPNGTFAGLVINEQNSHDPQSERHIFNNVSYGRQIGWLVDAVDILIKERTGEITGEKDLAKLDQLQSLRIKIDHLKEDVAQSRLARVQRDLAKLDKTDLAACKTQIDALIGKQRAKPG